MAVDDPAKRAKKAANTAAETHPAAEVRIVGYARTPWRRREDAPHQPTASPQTEGVIEIEPEFREALSDLGSFRRIWIVFLFDLNHGWAPKVRPPRGGPKRGVFATRAPHRPSQIGLTCVAVREVDVAAGRVLVTGLDLLDATPVVDIKPYLPMVDAFPDAGHGWLEEYLAAGVEPRLKKPYRPMRQSMETAHAERSAARRSGSALLQPKPEAQPLSAEAESTAAAKANK